MGFFNELAGWAHIANVNIHSAFSDDSSSNESTTEPFSDKVNRVRFMMCTRNKALNLCADNNTADAYYFIMKCINDKKIDQRAPVPGNVSMIKTIVNNDGNDFTEEDILSAIYVSDVIQFIESKGVDISELDDNLMRISNVVTNCKTSITPKEVAERSCVPLNIVNMYFGWLNEYAARNKALILGCDITDSCDVAEISEFLRKNNISADSVDIEEIKKEFPKFTKERINTLLGTIQLIAFVENRGLDLISTPKLMDIVTYIAKLEPESGLPSSEKIAEDTGASRELVEKYFRILREYVQEHRSR